jgi:hypothetical protein
VIVGAGLAGISVAFHLLVRTWPSLLGTMTRVQALRAVCYENCHCRWLLDDKVNTHISYAALLHSS